MNKQDKERKRKHMRVLVSKGPLRRKVTRGDIEQQIGSELKDLGAKILYINWKKKMVHFIDDRGHRKSHTINYTSNLNPNENYD